MDALPTEPKYQSSLFWNPTAPTAKRHEVEGTVPSQWWLDLKVENQQLRARLDVAEAYIPSRDFADYQGDADRAAAS